MCMLYRPTKINLHTGKNHKQKRAWMVSYSFLCVCFVFSFAAKIGGMFGVWGISGSEKKVFGACISVVFARFPSRGAFFPMQWYYIFACLAPFHPEVASAKTRTDHTTPEGDVRKIYLRMQFARVSPKPLPFLVPFIILQLSMYNEDTYQYERVLNRNSCTPFWKQPAEV